MPKWLKTTETIRFEVRDAIAHVTFNRPEKRNAQSMLALQELNAAMMEADDLKSVRVIVLSGEGKDFCSGADISAPLVAQAAGFDPAEYRDSNSFEDDSWRVERSSELRLVIQNVHKPVIAKVHGNCLAVGTDIALNCDFVFAAHDARIGFPATRSLGSPANHMWLYLLGPQWAKRILMTGDVVSGRDAAKLGLAMRAVKADKLDREVEEFAKRLALVDPELQASHKRIVNLGLELMGWKTLQRLAAETDARAHLAPAYAKFADTAREHGVAQAFRLRDAPFGNGTISLDEEAI